VYPTTEELRLLTSSMRIDTAYGIGANVYHEPMGRFAKSFDSKGEEAPLAWSIKKSPTGTCHFDVEVVSFFLPQVNAQSLTVCVRVGTKTHTKKTHTSRQKCELRSLARGCVAGKRVAGNSRRAEINGWRDARSIKIGGKGGKEMKI
jgi:hypothetical protein